MKAIIKIRNVEEPENGEIVVGNPKQISNPDTGNFFLGQQISYIGNKMIVEKINFEGFYSKFKETDQDGVSHEYDCVIHLYCKAVGFDFAAIF